MATDKHIDVYLQPGEYFVGDSRYRLRTLLGSCVSVTLWHPRLRIGAMSHFLLPTRGQKKSDSLDGRYGDEAMMLMLRELMCHDAKPEQCLAKIFGGANMFPAESIRDTMSVGRKNGTAARELLLRHRIGIASEHLFGVGHRKIIFDIASGDVWARQVQPADPDYQGQQ